MKKGRRDGEKRMAKKSNRIIKKEKEKDKDKEKE